jgi:hypothetical protein
MRISDTFFKKADMDFLFFCLPVCLSVRQLKQTAMKENWAEARGDGILSRVRTGFHPVRSIREIPSHIRNIWIELRGNKSSGIEFPLFANVRTWLWRRCVKEMESHGNKPNGIESRPNKLLCSRALARFPLFADVRAWLWSRCVKEMESHGDRPNGIESRRNKLLCSRALAQFPFIAVCFS